MCLFLTWKAFQYRQIVSQPWLIIISYVSYRNYYRALMKCLPLPGLSGGYNRCVAATCKLYSTNEITASSVFGHVAAKACQHDNIWLKMGVPAFPTCRTIQNTRFRRSIGGDSGVSPTIFSTGQMASDSQWEYSRSTWQVPEISPRDKCKLTAKSIAFSFIHETCLLWVPACVIFGYFLCAFGYLNTGSWCTSRVNGTHTHYGE